MIKVSTFLLLLLALNVFATTGSSIHRENDQSLHISSSPSRPECVRHHRLQHPQRKWVELRARAWLLWLQQRGCWTAEWVDQQTWNPGSSNTNNGQGYNDGSSGGSGYNRG